MSFKLQTCPSEACYSMRCSKICQIKHNTLRQAPGLSLFASITPYNDSFSTIQGADKAYSPPEKPPPVNFTHGMFLS